MRALKLPPGLVPPVQVRPAVLAPPPPPEPRGPSLRIRLETDQMVELACTLQNLLPKPAAPKLLDRQGLAQALHTSTACVDDLRRAGLPTTMLGPESPRWLFDEVVLWVRANGPAIAAESDRAARARKARKGTK